MKDHVIIKSNKYGLTVYLDSEIEYKELLVEIENKFRASSRFFRGNEVALSFENRILTKAEEKEIVGIISTAADIRILCIIDHDAKTNQMYKSIVDETLAMVPEADGTFYRGTLKRRQLLETERSIIIIGDIEEGATVVSKGNIIVIGAIYGSAQAGASGKVDAFIAALDMEPAHLKIGDLEVRPVIGGRLFMGEVIVVTSGKGGVGKTTTTANLGAGLSRLDKKTVIIDTDLGLRNLDVVLGLENLIVYNLVDVIEGTCRLKQALIRDKRYENLYLLPSAQTKDKTAISPEQMRKLTAELREEYDYILLDCPAGIEQGFQNAIAGADRALVVTTPEVSAIRDADRIIGLLETNGIRKTDLIINRIRTDMVKRGDMMSVDDVTEILSVPLIGAIPDDEQVVIGTNQGEPVIGTESLAGNAYINICKRILGIEVPFLDLNAGQGFFSRLSRILKRN